MKNLWAGVLLALCLAGCASVPNSRQSLYQHSTAVNGGAGGSAAGGP